MKVLRSPLFIIGIIIRLLAILSISSIVVTDWYVPFLQLNANFLTLNPWETWIASGGHVSAFPYGYTMFVVFLPFAYLADLFNMPVYYGYGLTLITLDCLLLLLFIRLIPHKENFLLLTYWLSPIMFLALYLLGFNDIVPVFFLILSLYYVKCNRFTLSGLFLCIAVSAKLSMLLALPFFTVYFINNKSIKRFSAKFLKGIATGSVLIILPLALSSNAAMDMILSNPESWKALALSVNFKDGIEIYLVLFVYLLILYQVWRVKNLNFDLFSAILGIMFLLTALMTPNVPGWFVWAVPFLVIYQSSGDKVGILLVLAFSLIYVISILLNIHYMGNMFPQLTLLENVEFLGDKFNSVSNTIVLALGLVLSLRIWRESILRNDFFRLSKNPFMLGIVGNYAAEERALSNSIENLFGSHSVTKVAEESYSLWGANKSIWRVMTTLNPATVGLSNLSSDLISLKNNLKQYRSERKKKTWSQEAKVVIASGMHILYLPILRECHDLSIYLEVDSQLQDDTSNDGRLADLVSRERVDYKKFIKPQKKHADLVLSLQSARPIDRQNDNLEVKRKLVINSRHGFDEASLTRTLVGICGLHVNTNLNNDASEVELIIEGEVYKADIEMSAKTLFPYLIDFLDIYPKWHDGVRGLMQLIVLSHMEQSLSRRLI